MALSTDDILRNNNNFMVWIGVTNNRVQQFVIYFLMYFADTSSVMPISLVINIEIVKIAQSYFIDFDKLMYCPSKDRYVLAKNTIINEELGQV